MLFIIYSGWLVSNDTNFIEFAGWIEKILSSRNFLDKANEFVEIERKRTSETVCQMRTEIINRFWKIKNH